MVSRLPIPGSDSDNWGVILNDFLTQELINDNSANSGKLKIRFNGEFDAKYTKPADGIPESDLASDVQSKLNDSSITIPDGSITNAKLVTTPIALSAKAAPNGVASLDNAGKVPLGQLPETSGMQTLVFASGNYPVRPSTGVVMWIGPTQPSGWQQNDLWLKTS